MNPAEVAQLIQLGSLPTLQAADVASSNGRIAVRGKIALPVHRNCSWGPGIDLEIFDHNGALIGVLCNTKFIDPVDVRTLTEWQLVAYLTEVPADKFDQPLRLQTDYVVLYEAALADYERDLRSTSAVWGGYSHEIPTLRRARTLQSISARPGMRLPTAHHENLLARTVFAAHPFERYLKLYHELELLLDWVVVRRIQALGPDLEGIGLLMSAYQNQDLPRLTDLIREFCSDAPAACRALARVLPFEQIARTIFQDHGKKGNPLGGEQGAAKWASMTLHLGGGYSRQQARQQRIANSDDGYDKLLFELMAYWIFRVRCCVAHHRIGEYLLTDNEEEFLLEFAEPMIIEAMSQILANPAMHLLIPP